MILCICIYCRMYLIFTICKTHRVGRGVFEMVRAVAAGPCCLFAIYLERVNVVNRKFSILYKYHNSGQ